MIPQVVTNETVTVISPNGVNFPQTDKPQPTHQMQDNLKKYLKAEIKVIAVNPTQNIWSGWRAEQETLCLRTRNRFGEWKAFSFDKVITE